MNKRPRAAEATRGRFLLKAPLSKGAVREADWGIPTGFAG